VLQLYLSLRSCLQDVCFVLASREADKLTRIWLDNSFYVNLRFFALHVQFLIPESICSIMAEYQPPAEPVAVSPKFDCPHGDFFVSITPNQAVEAFRKHSCNSCSSKLEPWLCLHCAYIGCSRYASTSDFPFFLTLRYVSGHASNHGVNQGHAISVSFSDFSVWCYECDSYIVHDVCFFALFLVAMFPLFNALGHQRSPPITEYRKVSTKRRKERILFYLQ
jgi:hypothetical protein